MSALLVNQGRISTGASASPSHRRRFKKSSVATNLGGGEERSSTRSRSSAVNTHGSASFQRLDDRDVAVGHGDVRWRRLAPRPSRRVLRRADAAVPRALDDDEIKALRDAAGLAGLDALYEIHEERELEKALKFDPQIVGVNNRDLKRFKTDLAVSEQLIPQIPDNIIKVSESGIFYIEDAERASACGADAILVGEALMRSEDTEALMDAFHHA